MTVSGRGRLVLAALLAALVHGLPLSGALADELERDLAATAAPRPTLRLHPALVLGEAAPSVMAMEAAPSLSVSGGVEPYRYRLTEGLLISGLGFAAVHMIDNVLSRRTFAEGTTGRTLIQLVYVTAGVAAHQKAGPVVWLLFSTGLLTAHSAGHLFRPSAPDHISTFHDNWADGENRLDIRSGVAGRLSQGVLLGLDLSFGGVFISSIRDGLRCGFTLRRTACMDR